MNLDCTSQSLAAAHGPARRQALRAWGTGGLWAACGAWDATGVAGWAALMSAGQPAVAQAAPRVAPRADSPEVGVDPALVTSGLTARWAQAMRRDLGWSARWTPLPSGALLRALADGHIDMGVYLDHPLAEQLSREGLIHDMHTLARTDVLLLGPTQDEAGIRSEASPAAALRQVLAAHAAGAARWLPPPPDSALAAWLARLGLAEPPKSASPPDRAPTRAPNPTPYRLITQAEWQAERASAGRQAPATRIWLAGGSDLMQLGCELARPFRTRHPGANMLSQWLRGPLGRQAVKGLPSAWRPSSPN